MDPLSVIASLAGISTAGLALSQAIYDGISSMRNAPTEMSEIVKSLCDLSFTLKELRRVLKDGQDIYKRKLIRRVASAVKRIGRVQREIELLIGSTGGFAKLKWVFHKSKAIAFLYTIESHKTGIAIVLQTIMLAVQLRQLPRESERTSMRHNPDRLKDCQREAELARQQAENMVRVSYHSLQQVTSEIPSSSSPSGSNHDDSDRNEGVLSLQIETQNPQCFDSAIWLYDLVFSTTIKATADLTTSESEHVSTVDGSPGDASSHDRSQESSKESAITPLPSLELISQHDSSLGQLQSLMQKPPVASTVINELLSEWTTLTEAEIDGVGFTSAQGNQPRHESILDASDSKVPMVDFKDCVGRKFELPFHMIKTWPEMEILVKKMFLHVDIIGPHVQAGHYDIINSRGNVVMPEVWKYSVNRRDSYTMKMWPVDRPHTAPPRPRPAPGTQMPHPAPDAHIPPEPSQTDSGTPAEAALRPGPEEPKGKKKRRGGKDEGAT